MTTTTSLPLPAITDDVRTATKNRLGGSRVAGIVRAWHETDARCVTCAMPTWVGRMPSDMTEGDRATFGHIVPASVITPGAAGGERGGYHPTNGVLQCADCNSGMSNVTLTNVHYVPNYIGDRFPRATRQTASMTDRGAAKAAARATLGY